MDYIFVQKDVDSICTWVDQNLLLNTLKRCYPLFSRKPTPTLPHSPLFVSDTILYMVKLFKIPWGHLLLMQLGLYTSTLFAWKLGGSLACSTVISIAMLTHHHFWNSIWPHAVWPHLEYASSVWDPYLKKDIEAIEHVQKFGLKVCLKDWHSSYDNLLNIANIPLLASRRQQLKLC